MCLKDYKIHLTDVRGLEYGFTLFNIHTVLGYLYGLFFTVFLIFYNVIWNCEFWSMYDKCFFFLSFVFLVFCFPTRGFHLSYYFTYIYILISDISYSLFLVVIIFTYFITSVLMWVVLIHMLFFLLICVVKKTNLLYIGCVIIVKCKFVLCCKFYFRHN